MAENVFLVIILPSAHQRRELVGKISDVINYSVHESRRWKCVTALKFNTPFASLAHPYKWLMSSSEPQEINVPRFHPHPKFFLPTNVHQLPAPNSYCAKSAPSVPGSFINHLTPAYSPILDAPLFPNFWGNFAWDRLADTEHVTELSSARHVWPQDKH